MTSERLLFFHLYVLWVNFKLITATSARSATKHTASLTSQCKDDIPPPLPTPHQHVHHTINPPPFSLTIIALGLDPRPGGTGAIGCGITAVTRGAQFTGAAGWIIQIGGGGGGGTGLLLVLVRVVGMGVAVAVVATFVLPNGEQGLDVGGVVVLHGERVAVGGAGGLALQPGPGSSLLSSKIHPPPKKKNSQNDSQIIHAIYKILEPNVTAIAVLVDLL
jgi:hypothetical protein